MTLRSSSDEPEHHANLPLVIEREIGLLAHQSFSLTVARLIEGGGQLDSVGRAVADLASTDQVATWDVIWLYSRISNLRRSDRGARLPATAPTRLSAKSLIRKITGR